MNRLPLRILASALIAAIPLWSPAVPRALAELEPGVLEQCRTEIANDPTLDPAVREIALGDVLPKLEEAASPDASREAKTELAAVEETAKQIVVASNTAAELPLPDRAALTAVVTQQSGVADTEVAQVVGQIEDKLKLGKEALAQGNFADAEKQFGELQKLCHDRGIDPGVFARSNEGLDFGRIAFDPAGDYVGKVIESHIVVESWRDLSGQTGLPDYQAGGLDIGIFEELSDGFVRSLGLAGREELDAERMKGLVGLYLNELKLRGRGIPDDVYGQLQEAVKAVYGSWYGGKAVQFRKAMDISGQWGTSVTLMQMIYGNDRGAGASVFFTRKPFSYEKGVYGETRERSTGDDLVYGRYANRPLAREQALGSQKSLEETDPELFLLHEELAQEIEKAMGGLPQEVEATYITNPDGSRTIYVLQTRRMEFHRGFTRRFHDICSAQLDIIGRGIGVHGGAISGIATLSSSAERIRQLRSTSDLPVILLRTMTSTDDVSLMPEIDGLVTSVGGATSHAAILAQKFDLSAVVGCSALHIGSDAGGEAYARIGEHEVRDGSYISVDGSTGLVYSGLCMVTVETETY